MSDYVCVCVYVCVYDMNGCGPSMCTTMSGCIKSKMDSQDFGDREYQVRLSIAFSVFG